MASDRYVSRMTPKTTLKQAISVALLLPSTSSLLAPSTPIRPEARAKLGPSAQLRDSRRTQSPSP